MPHRDQPPRILHLEDDLADAELVRHAVKKSGIEVRWAHVLCEKDFLAALDEDDFSIILADFSLSGFDGMAALKTVREKCPEVPFVFVSGHMPEDAAIEALRSGATDYVFKPKLQRLGPVIRRALDDAHARRTQREYAQALVRLQDCTDGVSGQEYFEQLLRTLAEVLHVRYAFIGMVTSPAATRVRTIALWTGNNFAANFEYDLAGTPCDNVVGKEECIFPKRVSKQFSDDRILVEMNIESYHGIPLSRRDGTPLGLLSVFDTAPMDGWAHLRPLLRLFAARGSLEMERIEAVEHLHESQRRLTTLMDNLPAMAYRCANDSQWTMEFVSKACEELTGYAAADLVGNRKLAYADITLPADRQAVWDSVQRAVGEKSRFAFEYRITTASGAVKWVREQGCGVYDEKGELIALEGLISDITGRKQTEIERMQLAAIVENSNDTIISRTLDGIITSWNAGAELLLGYTAAEAIGKPATFILLPELHHVVADNSACALHGKTTPAHETKRVTKDGRVIDVLSSHSPIRDGLGMVVGISLILHDITTLKRAEADRTRLAAIVENANDAIVSRDLERRILTWNMAAERLFGYTAAEVIGRDVSIIIPPDQGSQADNMRRLVMSGQPTPVYDSVRVTKDGRRIDVSVSQSPISDANGNLVGVSVFFSDISERKHAQEERALLAAIVENSNDAIISRTLDGIILSWNPGAERMLGYTASETIGRAVGFLMPPGQERHFECNSRSLLEGASVATHESRRITKDGRIIDVLVSVSPVKDGAGNLVAASLILSDISVVKQAETERRRLASLVESSHDAVITCTNDWQITSWNVSAQRLFGYSHNEALGQDIAMLVPLEKLTEFVRYRVRAGGDKPLEALETEWLDQEGRCVPVLVETWLLPGNGGIAVTCRDIAASRSAAAALRKSEEQFRQLATNIPEVFWIAEAPGNCLTYVSPAFENVWGRPVAGVLAKPAVWTDAIHPEDRGRVTAARRLAAQGDYSEEYRVVQPDGSLRWVQDRAFVVRDADGRVLRVAGIAEDITERKQNEDRLLHLAHYDQLTSLPNRMLLRDRLQQAIAQASRSHGNIAILFLDLDHFKLINDTLGHDAGDLLLQEVTERLQETLRIGDTVARFGGDEFTAILSPLRDPEDASLVAQKMLDRLAQPFTVKNQQVFVSASIGITLYPDDSDDPVMLMQYADIAMYRAKELGRNGYQFFTPELNARSRRRVELEAALRQASQNQEFSLHYQPRVNLGNGRVQGVEALMRWERPGHSPISPGEFVPVLEDTGLIVPVSERLFEMACRQLRQWHDAGLQTITMAVNLSPRQFQVDDIADTFSRIAVSAGVDMKWIEFEITESLLVHSPEEAAAKLRQLKSIGATVAIDDFGTGYSSLSYLTRFPIDCVKIDRSFVQNITTDPNSAAIALAVIGMARRLGLRTVAEGVETEGQLRYLAANDCDEMQGYYFSRPLPPAECALLLGPGAGLSRSVLGHDANDRCLLLIDDEPNVLSALCRALKSENYRILTATHAEEALEQLALHRVGVIVCDQRMPGISGTELLSRIRQLHPQTVRLALSGYTDLNAVLAAVNEGAIYKFLTKPWDDDQLRTSIEDAFRAFELARGATREPE